MLATILTIMAYLIAAYVLLKILLWATKFWLKVLLVILEIALVISAIGFIL